MPAFGRVAPEDTAGGDGYRGPATGVEAAQFPGAVSAEGESSEVGAVGVGVELGGLLVESGDGQGEHAGVGPVASLRTLGHNHDEGPALGVIANGFRQADLGLPHAFRAAFAAPVKKQNDGPGLVVVAAPLLRQVDLEAIGDTAELNAAVEKAGFLHVALLGVVRPRRGVGRGGRQSPGDREADRQQSQNAAHRLIPS